MAKWIPYLLDYPIYPSHGVASKAVGKQCYRQHHTRDEPSRNGPELFTYAMYSPRCRWHQFHIFHLNRSQTVLPLGELVLELYYCSLKRFKGVQVRLKNHIPDTRDKPAGIASLTSWKRPRWSSWWPKVRTRSVWWLLKKRSRRPSRKCGVWTADK